MSQTAPNGEQVGNASGADLKMETRWLNWSPWPPKTVRPLQTGVLNLFGGYVCGDKYITV